MQDAGGPAVTAQPERDPRDRPEQPGGDGPAGGQHLDGVLASPGDPPTSGNNDTRAANKAPAHSGLAQISLLVSAEEGDDDLRLNFKYEPSLIWFEKPCRLSDTHPMIQDATEAASASNEHFR